MGLNTHSVWERPGTIIIEGQEFMVVDARMEIDRIDVALPGGRTRFKSGSQIFTMVLQAVDPQRGYEAISKAMEPAKGGTLPAYVARARWAS